MSLHCPKCNSPMDPVTFSGVTVDRCTACEGIWFDGTEARDLKKIKGAESVDTGSAKVGKEHDAITGVPCPVCGSVMATKPDPYQPHIRYEVCPQAHGVYFDAGEFRDFVKEGLGDFFKSLLAKKG
jgi:Zn-finger nucleic acid-binding protein